MSKIIKLEQLQTFKNKCDTTYEKKLFPASGIDVKDGTIVGMYAVGYDPNTGSAIDKSSYNNTFQAYAPSTTYNYDRIVVFDGSRNKKLMSAVNTYIDVPYTIGQIMEVPITNISTSYGNCIYSAMFGYFDEYTGLFVPVLAAGKGRVNSAWETNSAIYINTTATDDRDNYPMTKKSVTTKNINGMANTTTKKEFCQLCLEGSTYYFTASNVVNTTIYTNRSITASFTDTTEKEWLSRITTCRITGYYQGSDGYWNRISKYTPTISSHNLRNLGNTTSTGTSVITSNYKDEMQKHQISVKPDYNTIVVNKNTQALEVDKTKMINKGKGIIIGEDNRISVDVTDRELHLYDVPPMKLMDVPSRANGYTCKNNLFTARSNCYLKFDEVIPYGEDVKTIRQLNCYRNGVAVPFEDMDSYVEIPISSFYQTFRSPVGVLQEDNQTTIGCVVYGQYNKFNQFVPFCFFGYHKSEEDLESAYQRAWCIASRITFTGGTSTKYVREVTTNLGSRYMYLYNYLDELSEDLNPSDIVSGTFTCTSVGTTSGNNTWEFVGKNADGETIVTVEQTQTEWTNVGIEFSSNTTYPHVVGDSYNFTYNNFNSQNSFVNVMDIEFGGGSPSGRSASNAIKDGAGFIQKQDGSYLWYPSSAESLTGAQTPSSTVYRNKFANCVVRLYIKDADTVPVPATTFVVYEIPNKVGDVDVKEYGSYCYRMSVDYSIENDIPLILESYLNNTYEPFHRTIAIAYDNETIKINENDELYAVTSGGGGTWGSITGTLSNQTDLQTALDSKANTSDLPTKTSDLTNDSGFITTSNTTFLKNYGEWPSSETHDANNLINGSVFAYAPYRGHTHTATTGPLVDFNTTDSYRFQLQNGYTTNTLYLRSNNNGSWSSWKEIGKQIYEHHVVMSVGSTVIYTTSSTPFDATSLPTYLTSHGFTSRVTALPICGATGTSSAGQGVIGIFYSSGVKYVNHLGVEYTLSSGLSVTDTVTEI